MPANYVCFAVVKIKNFPRILSGIPSECQTVWIQSGPTHSLDPDQARHKVGPDLGPDCLQRLSADNTNRQKVNVIIQ